MKNYTDLKLSTDPVVRESALRNEVRELRAALSDMEREVFSNLMSLRATPTINVLSAVGGGNEPLVGAERSSLKIKLLRK